MSQHKIWKYGIPVSYPSGQEARFTLDMPEGAQVLDVQLQLGSPMMWVLVDADNDPVERHFEVYGTGHIIPGVRGLDYVGTFQLEDGYIILHLFERQGE